MTPTNHALILIVVLVFVRHRVEISVAVLMASRVRRGASQARFQMRSTRCVEVPPT